MALHHRLLMSPHCRCALPASMVLCRTLSHTQASSSAPVSVASLDLVVGRSRSRSRLRLSCVSELRKRGGITQGVRLDFVRNFGSRAQARLESARARLSEVVFTEEWGVQLTDQSVQTGEGDDKGLKSLPGSNIVITAGADVGRLAIIKSAEFIKSSSKESECPREGYPEVALVGRSNVGKSSLINLLVRRKELAQTSKKPGKTQLINHFLINKSWYLVDLPGYGYAKAPTTIRTDWNEFTKDYFLKRETLICVLILVDASIPTQQIDLDCIDWLGRKKIPITLVFTKCDRRKKKKNGGKDQKKTFWNS